MEVRYPITGYPEGINRYPGDPLNCLEYFGAFVDEVLPDGRIRVFTHGHPYAREQYAAQGQVCPVEHQQDQMWYVVVRPEEIVEREGE